jgi:hypothetical protein
MTLQGYPVLTELALSSNDLNGTVPMWPLMTNMRKLLLSGNKLQGAKVSRCYHQQSLAEVWSYVGHAARLWQRPGPAVNTAVLFLSHTHTKSTDVHSSGTA